MRKYISKIILFSISIILIYCTKSYCVESGTVRMQINGGTTWTNIDVSESYAECESLNSATSTLGTTQLQAHLTTDADWSAMAIFSVSQYGGATSEAPTWTNGNSSGISDVYTFTQTTGILSTANSSSTPYTSGLFEEDGTTPKKYVKQWSPTREENDFVSFQTSVEALANNSKKGGTYTWLSSLGYWGGNTSSPMSLKRGLFAVFFGGGSWSDSLHANGGPYKDTTFRPVIWN